MFYLILNIRRSDLRMFAWNVLQACLGVPAVASFRKQKWKRYTWYILSMDTPDHSWPFWWPVAERVGLNSSPDHFWPFWWPAAGRGTFSPLAAMSPSSTVHGGQYDNKYLVCNIRIDGASGIRGGENFRRLSWTSSHQPRDRNTRNEARRYFNLLARVLRASLVLIIAYS